MFNVIIADAIPYCESSERREQRRLNILASSAMNLKLDSITAMFSRVNLSSW